MYDPGQTIHDFLGRGHYCLVELVTITTTTTTAADHRSNRRPHV